MISFISILLVAFFPTYLDSVTPSAQIKVKDYESTIIYSSPASFSATISRETQSSFHFLLYPDLNSTGCEKSYFSESNPYAIVARGDCTFEEKLSIALESNAKGLIIYNTLYGIYQDRLFASSSDYDCDNGNGYVDKIISPVYGTEMDATMPTSCTQNSNCASGKCVIANFTGVSLSDGYKVCCMWDLYITMGRDASSSLANAEIPVVFITMGDMEKLQAITNNSSLELIEVMIFNRPDPFIYLPTIIIYIIAVLTLSISSYYLGKREIINVIVDNKHYQTLSDSKQTTIHPSLSTDSNDEIHVGHAIMFVIYCAVLLTLMYFFNLKAIVTVIYVVFSSIACAMVVFHPFLSFLWSHVSDNILAISSSMVKYYILTANSPLFAFSVFLSHLLMFSWYFHRDSWWAWLMQDLAGMCVCFLCLSVIRLPNLKVLSVLLCLAFVYDVFFVFISPFIFSSSIMEKVASSSSDTAYLTTGDENYCEKYPDDQDFCSDDSLPMLFTVPSFSYYSGETILGLGDVILPGFLAVWAARYDFLEFGDCVDWSVVSDLWSVWSWWKVFVEPSQGFFWLVVQAYMVGLLLANVAVIVFQTGQPALLYIVPCSLGVVLYRAHRTGKLSDLWLHLPATQTNSLDKNEEQECLLNTNEQSHSTPASILEAKKLIIPITSSMNNYTSYQNHNIEENNLL
mmetsp:Transcript_5916/g.8820  ORF Transcript_5916/g.8820 Transcript_5916/m.8820 type:complete len:684 (+) Transcript_5916:51-2102(+)